MSDFKPRPSSPAWPTALITPGKGWARFTYAREDMELLGVVQMGMQIGALAQLPSGEYAQVNGDFIELLDADELATALQRAGMVGPGTPMVNVSTKPAVAPVVTVKKRRRIEMPTG